MLDSAMLQVWWARPGESEALVDSCAPWPWGIAGSGPAAPAATLARLDGKPVLWFWLGDPPDVTPRGTRLHRRWRDLARDVTGCLGRSLAGLRLAPNRGLLAPGGGLVLSAEVEGLLSSGEAALPLASNLARSATRAVIRHKLPVRMRTEDGMCKLEARA